MSTLLLAAHGTRHASGRECVGRIRDALATELGKQVVLGWVDVCEPRLEDLVGDGDVIVPAFLGDGFHVQHDVPQAACRARDVLVTEHLGTDARVLDALDARVREAGGPWPVTVLSWAGSRRRGSREATARVAEQMAERWQVEVTMMTPATMDETVEVLDPSQAGLATWLLAPGVFSERFAAQGLPCSQPLAEHPYVVAALADLVREIQGAQEQTAA